MNASCIYLPSANTFRLYTVTFYRRVVKIAPPKSFLQPPKRRSKSKGIKARGERTAGCTIEDGARGAAQVAPYRAHIDPSSQSKRPLDVERSNFSALHAYNVIHLDLYTRPRV